MHDGKTNVLNFLYWLLQPDRIFTFTTSLSADEIAAKLHTITIEKNKICFGRRSIPFRGDVNEKGFSILQRSLGEDSNRIKGYILKNESGSRVIIRIGPGFFGGVLIPLLIACFVLIYLLVAERIQWGVVMFFVLAMIIMPYVQKGLEVYSRVSMEYIVETLGLGMAEVDVLSEIEYRQALKSGE